MQEFASKVETRFGFSKKELFHILITSLVSSFGLTLNKGWGFFDLTGGTGVESYIANLIIITFLLFIFLLIHFALQKLVAIKIGYASEYRLWVNGMLIGPLVCLFTYGYFPLFFTGTLVHDVIPKLRVGVFRGGVKHKDLGMIAFAGPFANLVMVGLLAPIYFATNSAFFKTAIVINLLIALFSLLPIPTFEKLRQFTGGTTGLYLWIASRWVFILVFVTVLIFTVLILLFNIFSYIIALLIGIVMTIIYYSRFEMK